VEAVAQPAFGPARRSLKKNYAATALLISFLVGWAPALYNSDLLPFLALLLLAVLLILGVLAGGSFLLSIWRQQWPRSLAWLLLAGLNFVGWWVNYRISVEAMQLPLSPEDPALSDLVRWAFAPYFSS